MTRVKNTKGSLYQGVYRISNGWKTAIIVNKKKLEYGPFDTEIDAAKYYDCLALKYFGENARMNVLRLNSKKVIKKTKTIIKHINIEPKKKTIIVKNKDSKNSNVKKGNENEKRKKFPIATRLKVAKKQEWNCNWCKEKLPDTFIIDHMVPLCLNGRDEEFNFQALCNSCERYKTSRLDYEILLPLSKSKKLTKEDVLLAQDQHYHKMMCTDPDDFNNNHLDKMVISSEKNEKVFEFKIYGINLFTFKYTTLF